MKRITFRLATLVAPVVLALMLGLAGCGEDHRRHDSGGRETVIIDRDRHEAPREGDRH